MLKQRLLGRAQARQGRMARKAKRGKFAVSSRVRQKFEQEGLGIQVRQDLGGNTMKCSDGGKLVVRSDNVVVEYAKASGEFETVYFASRGYLQVRLKEDACGRIVPARERLLELACAMDFGCRSSDGPTCYEDFGRVWVKLRGEPTEQDPLARELTKAGWNQYHTDKRVFCKKSTNLRQSWAVDFCERHSGEWWTLSRVSQSAVDVLFRSVEWCELVERVRPLPGNGTNEHAREFHPVRVSSAKKQARKRAALRAHRMEYGKGEDKVVLRPGYDLEGSDEKKIQFGKSAFATRDREKPVETCGVTVSAKRREAEFYAMYGRKRVRQIVGPQGKLPG